MVKCYCLNQVVHSKWSSNLFSRTKIKDWRLERVAESSRNRSWSIVGVLYPGYCRPPVMTHKIWI
jgi:hypothetical protein